MGSNKLFKVCEASGSFVSFCSRITVIVAPENQINVGLHRSWTVCSTSSGYTCLLKANSQGSE